MEHNVSPEPEFHHQQKTKKPPKKKILIAGAIVIGVLALIAAFGKGNPPPEVPSQEETASQLREHRSPLFSFSYPSGWREQPYAVPRGGTGVMVSPSTPEGEEASLEGIQIEVTPLSRDGSLERRVDSITWEGASEEETEVAGYAGVRLSGEVRRDVLTTPFQRTIVVFEKEGYLYTIRYEYPGGPAPERESFFSDVLSTLTLTEGAI